MTVDPIERLSRRFGDDADDVAQEARCLLLESRARGSSQNETIRTWFFICWAAQKLRLMNRGRDSGVHADLMAFTHSGTRVYRKSRDPQVPSADEAPEPWEIVPHMHRSPFPQPDVAAEARILARKLPDGLALAVAGEISYGDVAKERGTSVQNEQQRARRILRRLGGRHG